MLHTVTVVLQNTLILSQSQRFSCHICFGDVMIYENCARPFSHLRNLRIRKYLMHPCFPSNMRRKRTVIPTPRTIFMHSSSKITGSLRASLPLSKVRIPFRDWTTMDWTVILTWKTNSCHFWILCIIIFGVFCIIIFVTLPGSVPQGQQAIIFWTALFWSSTSSSIFKWLKKREFYLRGMHQA